MSLLDDIKDKGSNLMDNSEVRAKIEQLAQDKGISIDEAKEHFMKEKESK